MAALKGMAFLKEEKQGNKINSNPQKSVSKSSLKKQTKVVPISKTKSGQKKMPDNSKVLPTEHSKSPLVNKSLPKTMPNIAKKISKKRKTIKRAKNILIVFLLIAVALITVIKFGDISFSNIGSGTGYPYQLLGANSSSFNMIGSDIIVLDNDSTRVLNSTAKEISYFQHTFSNAVMDTCNGRAIVYDMASGRFKVLSRFSVLLEKDVGVNILATSIGRKGNLAIASKSLLVASMNNKGNSEIDSDVFSADYSQNTNLTDKKNIFVWKCAVEHIAAVALSDNGKSVAVAVVGAKDAELYSKLFVFDFDKNEAVASFEYPETTLVKVKFGSRGTVHAIGDNLLSVVTLKTQQKQDVAYGVGVLHRLHIDEKGKISLVLSSFGNIAQNELKVFDSKGLPIFEKSFDQEVSWVSCDENYTSVLLDNEVQSFDNKGKQMGSIKTNDKAEKVFGAGKKIYIVDDCAINQYSVVGLNQ